MIASSIEGKEAPEGKTAAKNKPDAKKTETETKEANRTFRFLQSFRKRTINQSPVLFLGFAFILETLLVSSIETRA